MKEQSNTYLKILKLFVSFLGIGFLPKAPGTWASLFTIPFLIFLDGISLTLLEKMILLIFLTLISTFATEILQKRMHLHDPGWIVIDEVLGMMTAWLFLTDHNFVSYLVLFGIFRFFDIVKIWPASYFDKKIKHGFGTIADDIVSGIFTGFCLILWKYFL
jgi:phosphatidylglycerophosphatase A